MTKRFDRDGVRFQYPTNWSLAVGDAADGTGWSATVDSPVTATLTVHKSSAPVDVDRTLDESLATLRGDYPELETEPRTATVGGVACRGYAFDFIALDTTVTGWVYIVTLPAGSLIVMGQVGALDAVPNEQVLQAVLASVQIS